MPGFRVKAPKGPQGTKGNCKGIAGPSLEVYVGTTAIRKCCRGPFYGREDLCRVLGFRVEGPEKYRIKENGMEKKMDNDMATGLFLTIRIILLAAKEAIIAEQSPLRVLVLSSLQP